MEQNITENQRLHVMLQFIKRHQKLFWASLVGIAVIVAAVTFWQQRTLQKSLRASEVYQQMLMAEFANDPPVIKAKGQYLIEEYARTPYAQMAGLLLAKDLVKDGELDRAADQLRWVIKHASSRPIILELAKLRLAYLLQYQGKSEEALKLLTTPKTQAFTSLYAEARGDIYVSQQNLEQARVEYLQAVENLPAGTRAPLLQLKLTDLGVDNHAS